MMTDAHELFFGQTNEVKRALRVIEHSPITHCKKKQNQGVRKVNNYSPRATAPKPLTHAKQTQRVAVLQPLTFSLHLAIILLQPLPQITNRRVVQEKAAADP